MKILDERELKMMDYLRLKSQLDHCFLTQMAAKNKEDRQKTKPMPQLEQKFSCNKQ
jgi:hypothetical protein